MTDFEQRLRAAMKAAAAPPPTGLLAAIRRRHRLHMMRLTAAGTAMAACVAVAIPLTVHGIAAGHGSPRRIATVPAATVPAATGPIGGEPTIPPPGPDTALRDCMNSNGGTMSSDWKKQSIQAGPVWFTFARPAPGAHGWRTGTVTASALNIAVSNGHTAIVTAAPSVAGRFRFLARFHSGNEPYRLREGSRALKLIGCAAASIAPSIPPGDAPGLTMWWQGYVTNLRGCIPLDVRTPPSTKTIRVTIAATGCKA